MSRIASQSLGVPVVSSCDNGAPHPVSSMIDATETLYRFTAEEFEQIAEILVDDRVELIDGYLVKNWIVNLVDRQIEVYADPCPDGYATCVIYRSGQHVPSS